VQCMQTVFRDAAMREQAGLIKVEVERMMDDVHRLRDRVLDLQRHFGQASQDIDRILISADKVSKRGLRIEQLELDQEYPPRFAATAEAQERKLLSYVPSGQGGGRVGRLVCGHCGSRWPGRRLGMRDAPAMGKRIGHLHS